MILFLTALFAVQSSFSAEPSKYPAPVLDQLPNGMKVAWFSDARLPTVEMSFLFPFGNRDDEVGKSGQSEMIAALLDRGSAGKTAREVRNEIENLGASRQMTAAEDTFSVGVYGFSKDADALLQIMSEILLQPSFSTDELEFEKARLIDRWQRVGDSADALAGIVAHRILTHGTSYGRGSLQKIAELKKIQREDLVRFHKRFFIPDTCVLAIVGRFDREELRKKIVARFSEWKPAGDTAKIKSRPVFSDPRWAGISPQDLILIDRPGVPQAEIRIVQVGPGPKNPDRYPLMVGNALLGEYFHSRLNSLIRDQLGLTYGIGSQISYNLEQGRFRIASATGNKKVGTLIHKTLNVVEEVVSGQITDEEVKTAKQYLMGSFPLGMSTLASVANRWVAGHFGQMGPDYLNEFLPKISAVTKDEVVKALQKEIRPKRFFIVVAGDAKVLRPALEEEGFKKIKLVKPQDLM
ncbi:MAG: insulinase family protein [Bdellovibrionales bacterium]|nr:insulinase family protein [Bdellovibrionales bacterium]